MKYIVTVGIKDFSLTEEQKNLYLEALSKGATQVQLGEDFFLSTNFQSLTKEREEARIYNPLASSPDFKELMSLSKKGDDLSVRRKMVLEKKLNTQYPYEKNSKLWELAKAEVSKLDSLVKY